MYDISRIALACSCLMPDERHYIVKALEGSIEKTEKTIKRTKERIKIDELEQDKMNIQTIIARVGHTPDC